MHAHVHTCKTCKTFEKTIGPATKGFDVRKVIEHAFGTPGDRWGLEWGFPLDTNSQQTPIYIIMQDPFMTSISLNGKTNCMQDQSEAGSA